MWMYFGVGTIGDPDRGVFIEVRPQDEPGALELVHVNLAESGYEDGLVLVEGDEDTCFEVLMRLGADLDADPGLLELLSVEEDTDVDGLHSEEFGWFWLDGTHLANLNNSAFITIGDADTGDIHATVVIYMTRHGGIALFAGPRADAETYLFVLAGWLGASDVIGETAGELTGLGDGSQRAKA